MTQKDAVYQAVVSVFSEEGISFRERTDNASSLLNRKLRARVNAILVSGFTSGDVKLETSFDSQSALKTYISGLVSNWIRKDPRLNGGTNSSVGGKIVSKAKSSDPQLKALKLLLSQTTDNEKRAEIESFIEVRLAELAASQPLS